jgi:proteasome lid subunit RPN8/RPN11
VPSDADCAAQRASGMPWHILGADGAWAVIHAA